jgi:hypothetical protein
MNKDTNEIRKYYTDEIRGKINKVTNSDMKILLKNLEGTPLWFAILKYTQERVGVIQDSFLTLDPKTEATKIARYQGAITGILDLQDAVLSLKFESEKQENPNEKKENLDDLGGAYGVI